MRMPDTCRPTVTALLILILLATAANAQPVVDPTDLDMDGEPGLAVAPEVAFEQVPSALVGTGSLLIDRSHGNNFEVNGFTDFLASQGWTIAEHQSGTITESTLQGYDILMVPMRNFSGALTPYTTSEVGAIQAFLASGGGLWNLFDSNDPTGTNTLSSTFGVEFQADIIRDPTNNEGREYWPTIHEMAPHPTVSSVDSFGYYLGACLVVSAPAFTVGRGDEDSYSGFCPEGTRPAALAAWESAGRAVFCGDQTPTHPNYYPERLRAEEQLLLQSIVNWLLGPEPNATAPASWGTLKGAYHHKGDSTRP